MYKKRPKRKFKLENQAQPKTNLHRNNTTGFPKNLCQLRRSHSIWLQGRRRISPPFWCRSRWLLGFHWNSPPQQGCWRSFLRRSRPFWHRDGGLFRLTLTVIFGSLTDLKPPENERFVVLLAIIWVDGGDRDWNVIDVCCRATIVAIIGRQKEKKEETWIREETEGGGERERFMRNRSLEL